MTPAEYQEHVQFERFRSRVAKACGCGLGIAQRVLTEPILAGFKVFVRPQAEEYLSLVMGAERLPELVCAAYADRCDTTERLINIAFHAGHLPELTQAVAKVYDYEVVGEFLRAASRTNFLGRVFVAAKSVGVHDDLIEIVESDLKEVRLSSTGRKLS